MTLTISLIAIVLVIIIGWKFKVNAGIVAMGFAFLIGETASGDRCLLYYF